MHAASLGEYEQGKPLIDELKRLHPDYQILLTFFSPSGYQNYSGNDAVDFVAYLPADFPSNAQKFIELVDPKLAIFIKYEFWYYYMVELHRRSIPLILVSAIFRKNQMFFHPLGGFYLESLRGVNHFFVQDTESVRLLQSRHITQVSLVGDTRFDRVLEIASTDFNDEKIERFVGNEIIMVLGSVWASDWVHLEPVIQRFRDQMKFIIAPHHVGDEDLKPFLMPEGVVKYSEVAPDDLENRRLLIIDNIGMLASVYRYGHIAYVGGAFHGALHNVLEPAVYGMPVIFGQDDSNSKFVEAAELPDQGGATVFGDFYELVQQVERLLTDSEWRKDMGQKARDFVKERAGATANIMKEIDLLL